MLRPIHFDISCDDPDRAAKFYSETFGWKIAKWDGNMEYYLVDTGPDGEIGINGGLMRRSEPNAFAGTINTIEVAELDHYIQTVTENGGEVVSKKTPIPGVGYLAYCKDTEGNMFGIIQFDAEAS